jgi:hypothetical protein
MFLQPPLGVLNPPQPPLVLNPKHHLFQAHLMHLMHLQFLLFLLFLDLLEQVHCG